MENIYKYAWGAAAAMLSLMAPVRGLVVCALVFVAIDFVTGIAASYKRARREGRPWSFKSRKAWNTVCKAAFVMGGIVLAWLIDSQILGFMNLRLANIFTGFVCGVEFWSYLENAAEISQHPVFRGVRRILKRRLGGGLDCGEGAWPDGAEREDCDRTAKTNGDEQRIEE